VRIDAFVERVSMLSFLDVWVVHRELVAGLRKHIIVYKHTQLHHIRYHRRHAEDKRAHALQRTRSRAHALQRTRSRAHARPGINPILNLTE
jgi:hypothetical protein